MINLLLCEDLEILLTNLDHKLDLIPLSEAWSLDSKRNRRANLVTSY